MAFESTYRIGAVEVHDYEVLAEKGAHRQLPSEAAGASALAPDCVDPASFEHRISEAETKGFDRGIAEMSERIEKVKREYAANTLKVIQEASRLLDKHYRQIEPRVVALSLDVAAKILESEAKTSPMLVAGAVRCALDRDRQQMSFVLSVSTEEYGVWLSFGGSLSGENAALSIKIDPAMTKGDCELRANSGVLELRPEKQLEELLRNVQGPDNEFDRPRMFEAR